MDEIAPLIIFILYILYSIFGSFFGDKNKKRSNKSKGTSTPSPSRKKKPSSLEEFLTEIIDQSDLRPEPAPEPQPVETVTAEESYSEGMDFKGDKSIHRPELRKHKERLFEKENITKELPSVLQTQIDKTSAPKKKYKTPEKKINIVKKIESFHFDPVDAVIYSEIINKKYDF